MDDPRRGIPRTDTVLADPRLADAAGRLGPGVVKAAVRAAQQAVRDGRITPDSAADEAVAALPETAAGLRPVVNATGILLHTNLGRAPLSDAARAAVLSACGTTDVELDLISGTRGRRGRTAIEALLDAVPAASAAHVVNNNAAALCLAATALAREREIVVSRGELIEIGDGFRLPELLACTGARLREVGTTNRTNLDDYARALGPATGFILKVHPSNFRVTGFTAGVDVAALAGLGFPVVADVGSGLLVPDRALPEEPDVTTWLRAGAALVTASGDKLLGGPQSGLIFGDADLVDRLRRHPLARALRVDKLTLAALEATVRGPATPTFTALHADPDELARRARGLVEELCDSGVDAQTVETVAAVGGGGAPGVQLPSAAVSLPEPYTDLLRHGTPAVVGRTERGRCLLDLRTVPAGDDRALLKAILAVSRTA